MVLGLKFISGRYQGGELLLPEEGELLVGRATELDLVLAEDMVSRKHAKLVAQGGALSITDLGSTNGTFVNGEKVRRVELKPRDRILIGTSILKVIDASELGAAARDRADVKEMMERLAFQAPAASTMSGELTEVPLPDLLQLFATNQKSGVLTISGEQRGKTYIKGGRIVYAAIGGEAPLPPMKALCRMLMWDSGAFVLEPYEDAIAFPETFQGSTEALLIEALRQVDELRRLAPELPAAHQQLRLRLPLTPKLSALVAVELDVLQLAISCASAGAVVDRFPGTDLDAWNCLHKLVRLGYLEAT